MEWKMALNGEGVTIKDRDWPVWVYHIMLVNLKCVYQKDAIQFHQTPKLYSLTIWKVKALIWSRTPQAEDDDKNMHFTCYNMWS